tara:strand:+ start:701 stop:850 length:150 start_codon:yes stop_codon:yes gene_type:complete
MKLTKKEIQFLDEHFYDIYYALNVRDMTKEGQNIFESIQTKLSKEIKNA